MAASLIWSRLVTCILLVLPLLCLSDSNLTEEESTEVPVMTALVPPPDPPQPPLMPPEEDCAAPSYSDVALHLCPSLPYHWFAHSGKKQPRVHIECVPRNRSENGTDLVEVEMVNSLSLLQHLGTKNETNGHCYVVLFHAPWCIFCARMAPHYNALARAFPQLHVLAINAAHFSNLNSRYGTISVPNILVFHNSKAVARFNKSVRTLKAFSSFLHNVTGIKANSSITVEPHDYEGPLPSQVVEDSDPLLWLSWIFVFIFISTLFCRSSAGQRLYTVILEFGQEHHHHEHID